MFKVGDIVEITAESDATGMLDFEDGKGYAVLNVGLKFNSANLALIQIKLVDESGRVGWYAASHFKLKEEAKVEKKECLFKEGQVVYCLMQGKGIVYGVSQNGGVDYPVKVDFKNGDYGYYTTDGKFTTSGARTLYFSEPKIEAATEPAFEPVLKEGDVVIAVDKDGCSEMLNVKQELECQVKNDRGTLFYKEAFTFYRLGEKIKFN